MNVLERLKQKKAENAKAKSVLPDETKAAITAADLPALQALATTLLNHIRSETFPDYATFIAMGLGRALHSRIRQAREETLSVQEGIEIDQREAQAIADGKAWLAGLTSSTRKNIELQMGRKLG